MFKEIKAWASLHVLIHEFHMFDKKIRHYYYGPVIMLAARDEDMNQVVDLEISADD